MSQTLLNHTFTQSTTDQIAFRHRHRLLQWWLNVPKGVLTPIINPVSSKEQESILNPTHSFLQHLSQQTEITHLLNTNYQQYQTDLINRDLENIEHQNTFVNQLLTAHPLIIITHNTRKLSDTTKFVQILETLTIHQVDFCGLTETGHAKGQPYKQT